MHIQANTFVCTKSSIKDKTLGKVKATGKFVNQYKNELQASRLVVSLVSFTHLRKICQYKKVISMSRFANQYKTCYKRNGLKSWLFCWFLSPSCDDHECAYACISLSFVRK